MAENRISLASARGNFLTWCISGYMPMQELCRPLYVAQKLDDAANAMPGEFYVVYSVNEARNLFGAGSIAALMAIQHFCSCPELPLYITPLDDPTGGTKAVHTITLTGPATDNGALAVAILDEVYVIGVIAGATADSMATALSAQLLKNVDLPYDVTVATNVITLTAKNAGTVGSWFQPVFNPNFGDHFPDGVIVQLATPTPGVGVVDAAPAVAV